MFTEMSRSEIAQLLATRNRPVGLMAMTGSGAFLLADEHPDQVVLLEPEQIPSWGDDLLIMRLVFLPPELAIAIEDACPNFDVQRLLDLDVHAGVLLHR